MSEQDTTQPEALELGSDPAANLVQILDFLAPGAFDEAPGEGGAPGAAAAPEPGQQPPAAEGAGDAASPAGDPAAGDAGVTGAPGAGAPAAGDVLHAGPGPGAGTLDADSLRDAWGELSTNFEEGQSEQLKQSALAEVRETHGRYFEAVQKHPRRLVGQQVPALDGEGTITLRDSADAQAWQEAVKEILFEEVSAKAEEKKSELRDIFDTVHSSIDLFRNNPDLIPRTKQFDAELAEQAVELLQPYELRANDKLIGYSVPVQPMINQLRQRLAKNRAAASAPQNGAPSAPAAAPSPRQAQAQAQPRTEQGQWAPQGGIASKAGSSAEIDDTAAGLFEAFYRQNGMRI